MNIWNKTITTTNLDGVCFAILDLSTLYWGLSSELCLRGAPDLCLLSLCLLSLSTSNTSCIEFFLSLVSMLSMFLRSIPSFCRRSFTVIVVGVGDSMPMSGLMRSSLDMFNFWLLFPAVNGRGLWNFLLPGSCKSIYETKFNASLNCRWCILEYYLTLLHTFVIRKQNLAMIYLLG